MTDNKTATELREKTIKELIDDYGMLANDPLVRAYNEISDELMRRRDEIYSRKPEREFYKATCGYEYTIELPYDELHVGFDRAWIAHHDHSFIYKDPDGKTHNTCLSLCGYSRDEITKMIDRRIERLEMEGVDND